MESSVSEKRMDCGEANIAAASAIAPLLLEMIEKSTDEWRVQVRQIQDRRGLTQSALCILQQQTESVAITCDGMAADLSLAHEAIDEVSFQQGWESTAGLHGDTLISA
jgi:hypothetical protein